MATAAPWATSNDDGAKQGKFHYDAGTMKVSRKMHDIRPHGKREKPWRAPIFDLFGSERATDRVFGAATPVPWFLPCIILPVMCA